MRTARKTPTKRYGQDVKGMPCFAATAPITVVISPKNMKNAVPSDDENCAIALGCKNQLEVPYVSIGRRRALLALPHPKGVSKPGYEDTKWAVIRYALSLDALKVVIAADTGQLDLTSGVTVELIPPRPSDMPGRKRSGAHTGTGRKLKGKGQDRLTILGVRDLTGQR